MKNSLLFFVFLFNFQFLTAGLNNLRSPLNIPVVLTGNFGEIRSNHFHAGIDLKTNGTTNLPVFSVDDGFVSRISVSPIGYGKALYIDHPSGYTSVYGHLDKFSPEIEKWIKEHQYKIESFAVNLYPDKELFVVKKSEIVAFSGNSGSSGGPHLHFEMRKTENEHPVNPLLLGLNVSDKTKPSVSKLFVYPVFEDSHVQNNFRKKSYELVFYNGEYRIKNNELIQGWGKLGFGIDAVDYLDGNWSKCGIYKMELFIDSLLLHSFALDELNFNDMRYLNSHIDYDEYIRSKIKVHKTFVDPGNVLGIYGNVKDYGLFDFNDGRAHSVLIKIYDVNSNSVNIRFKVKSTVSIPVSKRSFSELFRYDRKNNFETDDIKVELPIGSLCNNLEFNYLKIDKVFGALSEIHCVHNKFSPIIKPAEISIKVDKLHDNLKDKVMLAFIDQTSGHLSAIGGEYSRGWVKATIKNFGNICIVADTIAPTITALSIKEKIKLVEANRIRFKIRDNLSGIQKYNGYIDDSWVLFEYDQKSSTITYNFDEHIKKGKQHSIKLLIEDIKGNIKEYNANFYY